MGITSAIVLFAVVWFMVFFVVLPLRMVSQGEDGEIGVISVRDLDFYDRMEPISAPADETDG